MGRRQACKKVMHYCQVSFVVQLKQMGRILTIILMGGSDEYEEGVSDVGVMSDNGTG